MCCRVKRCCCCLDPPTTMKVTAVICISVELLVLIWTAFFATQFLLVIVPVISSGILSHLMLFLAALRNIRCLVISWLVYELVMMASLLVLSFFQVFVAISSSADLGYISAVISAGICFATSVLLLHAWLVVLDWYSHPEASRAKQLSRQRLTTSSTSSRYNSSARLPLRGAMSSDKLDSVEMVRSSGRRLPMQHQLRRQFSADWTSSSDHRTPSTGFVHVPFSQGGHCNNIVVSSGGAGGCSVQQQPMLIRAGGRTNAV